MAQPIRTVTLYKREGSMDKVYTINLVLAEESKDQYEVTYANGRRGSSMQTGLKTPVPVSLAEATKKFESTEKSKLKDGYTPAESGQAYTNTPDAGRISGHRPMLPADFPKSGHAEMLRTVLDDPDWGAQEKMDGENRILVIADGNVVGANKNGLITNVPEHWQEFSRLGSAVLCGEQIGDTFHAFDIISVGNKDLREAECDFRYKTLAVLLLTSGDRHRDLQLVTMVKEPAAKRALRAKLDASKAEGLVYKRLSATFEAGKNSNSYREKFWEQMTCFVLAQNQQRSIAIGAVDPSSGEMVNLGNVTIPANHALPKPGAHAEVRFLYRMEAGSLIQATFLGLRTDVAPETITIEQITRIKRIGQCFDLDDETLSEQSREAILALGEEDAEQSDNAANTMAPG